MLASIVLASCTRQRSRSGPDFIHKESELATKLSPVEKVVILDSYLSGEVYLNQFHYKYKVNRYTQGVVGYALERNLYEVGDTIYIPTSKLR